MKKIALAVALLVTCSAAHAERHHSIMCILPVYIWSPPWLVAWCHNHSPPIPRKAH